MGVSVGAAGEVDMLEIKRGKESLFFDGSCVTLTGLEKGLEKARVREGGKKVRGRQEASRK